MNILLLNAGSSSLKFAVLDSDTEALRASGSADWAGASGHYRFASGSRSLDEVVAWKEHISAVERLFDDLRASAPELLAGEGLRAVGHRVVHGGDFTAPARVTDEVLARLRHMVALAPLHNPPSLAVIDAAQRVLPGVPHVACFDTAFHRSIGPAARGYPLPRAWSADWGIQRYGFHGLSHAYCARRAAELLGRPLEDLKLVVCHLGHGCSATAIAGGRSIDTTMGFTPLEGLMMATRSGNIDPGVVLHLIQDRGLPANEVAAALNRQSGLLGVSGVSADMRAVLAAADEGHAAAQLAVEMFAHRVRQAVGALAVTLGGLDALVFTAGIGENAAPVRARVCEGLACLGLRLDEARNRAAAPDACLSPENAAPSVWAIRTREDLSMLREAARVAAP
ncbi:MAG: acetate kinase [Planctomycetota bacterium]|nr:acetate kinase [Planctomycetota bacterium]